jgi:hypothetical protein
MNNIAQFLPQLHNNSSFSGAFFLKTNHNMVKGIHKHTLNNIKSAFEILIL